MINQHEKFSRRGLKTEFVCDTHLMEEDTVRKVLQGCVQLVYFSSESLINNYKYRKMLMSPVYKDNLVALVVDEAHCVKTWCDEFWMAFAEIGTLRSLISRNQYWFDVRRLRLTSSKFGLVRRLKPTTPPDNLVLQILGVKRSYGRALDYGRVTEEDARKQYIDYQGQNGHPGLFVAPSGFFIHPVYTHLGASPDGSVYDPSTPNPYGFLEIKCSYKYQDMLPTQAASKLDFWCSLLGNELKLKENHVYYSQVQGQMAVGGRQWYDFCTYTKKGIYIERITFDKSMWENDLLPKVTSFYDNCVAPEILYPKHPLGLKLRDLRNES